MKEVTHYQTEDGKTFATLEAACAHEKYLARPRIVVESPHVDRAGDVVQEKAVNSSVTAAFMEDYLKLCYKHEMYISEDRTVQELIDGDITVNDVELQVVPLRDQDKVILHNTVVYTGKSYNNVG